MPDEGRCPHCASVTPTDVPRCVHCGQRLAGLLQQVEPESYTEPWWQATRGTVPLPPQVREEAARAEAVARESERLALERRVAEEQALARERAAQTRREQLEQEEAVFWTAAPPTPPRTVTNTTASLTNCTKCGSSVGEAGAVFSFCLHCGADLPTATQVAEEQRRQEQQQHTQEEAAFRQQHQRVTVQTVRTTRVERDHSTASPMSAAFMSFLLPGIGQMMNGQGAKGVLLLLAAFVAMGPFGWGAASLPVVIGRLVAAIDAYRIAERRRERKNVRDGEWDLG